MKCTQISSADESLFVNHLVDVVSRFSLAISIFSIIFIVILSIFGTKKNKLSIRFIKIASGISLLILFGNLVVVPVASEISTFIKRQKLSEALYLWNNNNFGEAIDIFYGIYVDDTSSEIADDALGRIGGAYYNTQQYEDSILVSARLLYD